MQGRGDEVLEDAEDFLDAQIASALRLERRASEAQQLQHAGGLRGVQEAPLGHLDSKHEVVEAATHGAEISKSLLEQVQLEALALHHQDPEQKSSP